MPKYLVPSRNGYAKHPPLRRSLPTSSLAPMAALILGVVFLVVIVWVGLNPSKRIEAHPERFNGDGTLHHRDLHGERDVYELKAKDGIYQLEFPIEQTDKFDDLVFTLNGKEVKVVGWLYRYDAAKTASSATGRLVVETMEEK